MFYKVQKNKREDFYGKGKIKQQMKDAFPTGWMTECSQ